MAATVLGALKEWFLATPDVKAAAGNAWFDGVAPEKQPAPYIVAQLTGATAETGTEDRYETYHVRLNCIAKGAQAAEAVAQLVLANLTGDTVLVVAGVDLVGIWLQGPPVSQEAGEGPDGALIFNSYVDYRIMVRRLL